MPAVTPPDSASLTPAERRLLAAITLAALFIRSFAAWRLTWYNTDTLAYFDMATAILDGRPYSYFPNGYPLIIAATRTVLGEARTPAALVIMNVLASTAVIPLAAVIGARVFSARVGLLAAVLIAVWPNQVNYTRQIMTEPIATALIVLAIAALLLRRELAAGVAAYAAVLLRATLLPAVILMALWNWRVRGRRAAALYLLGVSLLAAGEWALQRAGVVAPAAILGGNLLVSTQMAEEGERDFFLDGMTPSARANPARTYLELAVDQPAAFAALRWRSLWDLWGPWPDAGAPFHPRSPAARAAIGVRFVAVLAAALVLVRQRTAHAWLLAIPILSVTLIHVAFYSLPRYTFTVEPFTLILAAALVVPPTSTPEA